MRQRALGFSLIEILVVIGILGLMMTSVVIVLGFKQKEMRDTKRLNDLLALKSAMKIVKNENGSYESVFCDLDVVAACAKKDNSILLKVLPDLAKLQDPLTKKKVCNSRKICQAQSCNYAFTKLEPQDYEVLFHLERGVKELIDGGCYHLTARGIEKN